MLQNVLESIVTVLRPKMSNVLRAKTEVHATRQSSSSSVTSRISRKITCSDACAGSQIACTVASPKTRGPPLCSHRMCPCSSERLTLHLRTQRYTKNVYGKHEKSQVKKSNQLDQVSESPTQHLQEDNTEGPNVTFFIVSFLGRDKYGKIATCIGFHNSGAPQMQHCTQPAIHTLEKLEIFDKKRLRHLFVVPQVPGSPRCPNSLSADRSLAANSSRNVKDILY